MLASHSTALSVVIPVHNAGAYLHRCVDSLISQSFGGNWDLFLIDDGSTDDSGAICDAYASTTPGISVIHTANQGASLARRLGLESARGEYVSFVDADDYVSPDYLATLFGLEQQFKIGISACGVRRTVPGDAVSSNGEITPAEILEGDALFHRFFKYEFWGLYGKLYRRDFLRRIPFPEETISEDYCVMAHLLCKTGRMAYTSQTLYYYERHADSLSNTSLSPRAFEEFINVKRVYDFVSSVKPEYGDYALSNAVETSVKLLMASRKHKSDFNSRRREITSFLSSHRKEILSCKPLNRKTAFLAFLLQS